MGNRYVYVAECNGLNVVPGSAKRVVTPDGVFTHPTLSPDGTRVAFWGICGGRLDVWVAEVQSCVGEPLTDGAGVSCHPSWSPDSSRLVYSCNRSYVPEADGTDVYGGGKGFGPRGLWILDLSDGNRRCLTDGASDLERPAWSPDGEEVAYVVERDGAKNLGRLNLNTGRRTAITHFDEVAYRPAWHPSNRLIAFNNKGPGSHYLWVVGADGERLRRISPLSRGDRIVHDHGAFWSRDGKRILFHSDRAGSWGIWWLDRTEGTPRPVEVPGFPQCSHAGWDAAERLMCFDASETV